MKGSRAVLALAAVVIIMGAAALWAQDQYSMPVNKVMNAGRATVRFDPYVYTFVSDEVLSVTFEKLDAVRVKLTIKPLTVPEPFEHVTVQWGSFQPVGLTLDSPGENSFILNTETGYAEK